VAYLAALWKHWWALMGSAAFTLVGLYAAWQQKTNSWIFGASLVLALAMFFVASYRAWKEEHDARIAAETERPDIVFEWDSAHRQGHDRIRLRNIGKSTALNATMGPFSWPEVVFVVPLEINAIHPNDPEMVREPFFAVTFSSGVQEIGYLYLVLRDRRFANREPLHVTLSFSDPSGNVFTRPFTLLAGQGGSWGPDVRIIPGKGHILNLRR
jgi:hypothetical protein